MTKLEFKPELDLNDIIRMDQMALFLLMKYYEYCYDRGLRCMITSLMEDVAGRVSLTHFDGRAFDSSIKGWKEKDINDCVKYFMTYYNNIGAISTKDLKPRVVLDHSAPNGTGRHLHFQVRKVNGA